MLTFVTQSIPPTTPINWCSIYAHICIFPSSALFTIHIRPLFRCASTHSERVNTCAQHGRSLSEPSEHRENALRRTINKRINIYHVPGLPCLRVCVCSYTHVCIGVCVKARNEMRLVPQRRLSRERVKNVLVDTLTRLKCSAHIYCFTGHTADAIYVLALSCIEFYWSCVLVLGHALPVHRYYYRL